MCAMEPVAARKRGRPRDPDLGARRKAEILAAAAAVFAEFGFATADVQVIADRLGVGKGTVYRYFPTKQHLFLAAVDRGLQELSDQIDAILADGSLDPLDQIRSAVLAYLAFFRRRPEMAELFIQERAAFRDRHTPLYFGEKYGKCDRDVPFVRALIAAGRLRDVSPERVLTVVGDLLYGTVLTNHLSGRPAAPGEQADAILDIVLHGILSDAERKRADKRRRAGEGKK